MPYAGRFVLPGLGDVERGHAGHLRAGERRAEVTGLEGRRGEVAAGAEAADRQPVRAEAEVDAVPGEPGVDVVRLLRASG